MWVKGEPHGKAARVRQYQSASRTAPAAAAAACASQRPCRLCCCLTLQVWRVLTCFTFLGKPSLPWLFQLVWL